MENEDGTSLVWSLVLKHSRKALKKRCQAHLTFMNLKFRIGKIVKNPGCDNADVEELERPSKK